MKQQRIVPISPQTPRFQISNPTPQTPMSQMQPGQDNPMTDLHKMALGVAMSNLLKRKKDQKAK